MKVCLIPQIAYLQKRTLKENKYLIFEDIHNFKIKGLGQGKYFWKVIFLKKNLWIVSDHDLWQIDFYFYCACRGGKLLKLLCA